MDAKKKSSAFKRGDNIGDKPKNRQNQNTRSQRTILHHRTVHKIGAEPNYSRGGTGGTRERKTETRKLYQKRGQIHSYTSKGNRRAPQRTGARGAGQGGRGRIILDQRSSKNRTE